MIILDVNDELKPCFGAGEKLIWSGRPKTGLAFRNSDFFLIPFSLFWCGFFIIFITGSNVPGANFVSFIMLVPFGIMGLYISVGRFIFDARKRATTVYGITDDRIIIISGVFSRTVNSINIKTLSDMSLTERSDNSGTITLGETDFKMSMFQGMDWPGVKQPPRLEFIEDVKKVYNKIVEQQKKNNEKMTIQ